MLDLPTTGQRPLLLVSVRSADEARIALDGGAELIDVKEPSRGSLGAADASVLAQVVAAVDGRVPVSAAAGELLEYPRHQWSSDGAALVKFGLAGCGAIRDWPERWRDAVARLAGAARPVAVVYADGPLADAPRPEAVLEHALAADCAALLVDTWSKSAGSLFDHWSPAATAQFCRRVHRAGLPVALAGSVNLPMLDAAMRCRPDVIAVRGAVCTGGRIGRLHLGRVRTFRQAMERHALESADANSQGRPAPAIARRG